MRYSLADVARVVGGDYPGQPLEVDAYATDSRAAAAGTLFFALKGAELDGHDFVADAAARSATGAVVERPLPSPIPQIVVRSSWGALFGLAEDALQKTGPLAVGVTGSNGKTSTKDFLAAALGVRYDVLKTEGNLNTETGVPLTLLRLEPGVHTALVAEMGMQGKGEIARLATLVRPRIGVVTVIGTVHLEFFASREDLARAKGELLEELGPDGVAVLNADDPYTGLLRTLTTARVVTFGAESGDYRVQEFSGSGFSVNGQPVQLRLPGRHQALNAAAALAAAEAAGVPLGEAAPRLAEVAPAKGRMREVRAAGGFTILDDSYNASPESMEAAFAVVAEHSAGRRLALLGEMRELGALAEHEHERIGRLARGAFDRIAVVDTGVADRLAAAAGAELLPDAGAGQRWVQENAREGDLVLIKASRGVALERVVDALVAP